MRILRKNNNQMPQW